ncbi:MAG: class I adenylate-forming enzyme family protein [Alphaproteobacteria bacterium]
MTWCGAVLADHAAARPTAPAIITEAETLDWAGFHRRIEGMAGALARGLARDAPVALVMRDGIRHVVATFALHRLGVPFLVLDPTDPPEVSAALAAAVGVRLTLGDGADAATAPGAFAPLPLDAEGECPAPPPAGDAICLFSRSSGTTAGIPRLVATTHAMQSARALAVQDRMLLGPGDRYLAIVSNTFALGRNSTYRAMLSGGAMIFPPMLREVGDLVDVARRRGATWAAVTPHHLRRLIAAAGEGMLLPAMRLVSVTAPLSAGDVQAIRRHVSPLLHNMYGTNEVGILAFAGPDDLDRQPGSVGRAPTGITVEAVDADGRTLPAGTVGELRFGGGPFPDGYRAASSGGGRFVGEWYYPGDAGAVDADGYIHLHGRVDDVVNVGGRKILPRDVEDCARAHPAVADAAVVALDERHLGAIAVVVFVGTIEPDALLAHCRERLGERRAPQAAIAVEAIPLTPIGKRDRRRLAEMALLATRRPA